MNNIAQNLPSAGLAERQQPSSEFQAATYIRKRSINASESLVAGLTIQTRDGGPSTLLP